MQLLLLHYYSYQRHGDCDHCHHHRNHRYNGDHHGYDRQLGFMAGPRSYRRADRILHANRYPLTLITHDWGGRDANRYWLNTTTTTTTTNTTTTTTTTITTTTTTTATAVVATAVVATMGGREGGKGR